MNTYTHHNLTVKGCWYQRISRRILSPSPGSSTGFWSQRNKLLGTIAPSGNGPFHWPANFFISPFEIASAITAPGVEHLQILQTYRRQPRPSATTPAALATVEVRRQEVVYPFLNMCTAPALSTHTLTSWFRHSAAPHATTNRGPISSSRLSFLANERPLSSSDPALMQRGHGA